MPAIVLAGSAGGNAVSVAWQSLAVVVTASGSADGYPAINVTDPATWSSWLASGTDGWVQYDFGSAVPVDALGISAHNLATSATGYSVQHSDDAVAWTTVTTQSPLTDEDIYILMPSVTARYWRVQLSGPAANIGVIVFTQKLSLLHAPIDGYTPLHHARQYTKLFNDSVRGQFLGNRVMSAGAETSVDMGFYERPWLESNIRPFEYHYNQGGTFFYAGCPSQWPLDMGYCRAGGDDETLAIEWTEADKMATLSFSVRSYVG